jgi:hypothetical protein
MKPAPYKLMLAGLFLYGTLFVGLRSRPMDFATYYHAGLWLRTGADLYQHSPLCLPFAYPPFAAWLCAPFSLVSLATAKWFWALAQGAALALAVHFAVRLSREAWEPLTTAQRWWLFAAAVLMSVRHLNAPLESSQTDLMITAMCLGGVLWLQQPRTSASAGVAFAAAAGMKGAGLLFLPFLARWRRWRAALAMGATLVVLNVMPSVQFPSPTGRLHAGLWLDSLVRPAVQSGPAANRAGVFRADEEYNQSLGGLLSRFFRKGCYSDDALLVRLEPKVVTGMFAALGAALLACAMWARRGSVGHDAAVVLVLMLLFSPKTSKAHYCSMLLPILLLTAEAVRTPRHWASLLWFAVAIGIGLLTKNVVGSRLCNQLMDYGYLVWFALVALACLWLRRERAAGLMGSPR